MSHDRLLYKLVDEAPVPVRSIEEWAEADPLNSWHLRTRVGWIDVSTTFLGIDHNYTGEGPPVLFETMLFGWPFNSPGPLGAEYQERYCTAMQARAGHRRAVRLAYGWPLVWVPQMLRALWWRVRAWKGGR